MRKPRWLRRSMPVAVAAMGMSVVVALATWNPSDYSFPRCWFHWATGWHCPGCGCQRALHALAHGEWFHAIRYNLFVVLSLPILLTGYLHWTLQLYESDWQIRWRAPGWWIWGFLVAMLLYTLLRNLPWHPFSWLAPPA